MLQAVINILERIGYRVARGRDVEKFDFLYTRYSLFDHRGNTTKRWHTGILVRKMTTTALKKYLMTFGVIASVSTTIVTTK